MARGRVNVWDVNVSLEFYNTLAGKNHWCRCQLLPCWIAEERLLKAQRACDETIQLLKKQK